MSQGNWKDKDPKKYPYLSINKHGIIGQHKTAATACRNAVKFEFGRVERWDRRPEDFTAEMQAAKSWWRYHRKKDLASLEAARSRIGKKHFDSPEMRKRRDLAIRKIQARESFEKCSLQDDIFNLLKRLSSRESQPNSQKIYGTYQGKSVFG